MREAQVFVQGPAVSEQAMQFAVGLDIYSAVQCKDYTDRSRENWESGFHIVMPCLRSRLYNAFRVSPGRCVSVPVCPKGEAG